MNAERDCAAANNDGSTKQLKNRRKREAAKKKKQAEKEVSKTPSNVLEENSSNEIVDHFDEELCWCIQQLEIGLRTQKPTAEQATKSRKLINQLRSEKTPKPKKRMLMKNNFGNYRDKMAKELKMQNVPAAKIVEVNEEVVKKSVFVRKKANEMPFDSDSIAKPTEFRFNFADPT